MLERVQCLEQEAHDSAEKHAKWEAAHSQLGNLRNEFADTRTHHAALEGRLADLHETLHSNEGNHHMAHEALGTHCAAMLERVQRLEQATQNIHDEFGTNHAAMDERLSCIEHLLADTNGGMMERVASIEHFVGETVNWRADVEKAHSKLGGHQQTYGAQHVALQERVQDLEQATQNS